MLADYRSAPVSEAEKALLGFIDKVNRCSNTIRQHDIDALHEHGWSDEAIYDAINVCALFNFYNRWIDATGVCALSDEAIYDAITVCALFNFYNRWIDATGVHDMPGSAYAASGKRLAQDGYVTFGSHRSS